MTREEWLNRAIIKLNEDVFGANGELPPRVHVSVGFPGGGSKHSRIGEYWPAQFSKDGVAQIFINPKLEDTQQVLAVLAHELIHAIHPEDNHSKGFIRVAKKIGLVRPWTATTASDELKVKLDNIKSHIGDYPHKAMLIDKTTPSKKSLNKMSCTVCGLTVFMTEKNKEKSHNLSCCDMELECQN